VRRAAVATWALAARVNLWTVRPARSLRPHVSTTHPASFGRYRITKSARISGGRLTAAAINNRPKAVCVYVAQAWLRHTVMD